jgi:alkylation response protein AidB-like acyl-CoA dehydrogenase
VQIGKSLKFVGQQSIQLHGGIGMTMEARIGHYFKRLSITKTHLAIRTFISAAWPGAGV